MIKVQGNRLLSIYSSDWHTRLSETSVVTKQEVYLQTFASMCKFLTNLLTNILIPYSLKHFKYTNIPFLITVQND